MRVATTEEIQAITRLDVATKKLADWQRMFGSDESEQRENLAWWISQKRTLQDLVTAMTNDRDEALAAYDAAASVVTARGILTNPVTDGLAPFAPWRSGFLKVLVAFNAERGSKKAQ